MSSDVEDRGSVEVRVKEETIVRGPFDDGSHYWSMVDRNTGILTHEEQEIIRNTVVAQAGVGGNADIIFTLAQLGFRKFRIADPDVFDLTNFNRQLGANMESLGMNKAVAIAREVKRIDPSAEVEVFTEGVTMDNVHDFVEGAGIIIDGIDIAVMHERKAMFDLAREQGIPVFTSPAIGFGAALGVFDPVRSPSFSEFFGPIPEEKGSPEWFDYQMKFGLKFIGTRPEGLDFDVAHKRRKEGKPPACAIGCRVNCAIISAAVIGHMFNRGNIPIVPDTWHIDFMSGKISKVGPRKRFLMEKIMSRKLGK